MANRNFSILMGCYGGGHVQSLLPVAKLIAKHPDYSLTVIGFTTARAAFIREGIPAQGYECLLEETDKKWLELAREHTQKIRHPDISENESLAYYALGLRDLCIEHGEIKGLELFGREGRKAFLPVHTFNRYLDKVRPDLVITSSSPRSELALLRAANTRGIKTLAVSDLFLQRESSYICSPDYAGNLTVMAGIVAEAMASLGYPEDQIHITGNPAFDALLESKNCREIAELRESFGVQKHHRLLLWACPSAAVSLIGRPFITPSVMVEFLEEYCAKHGDTRYLIRQHPSHPVVGSAQVLQHGSICPADITIESCLNACDQVILETSTVGLQAALLGKPVVTVGAGDYPPYAQYGLAVDVPTLLQAESALRAATPPQLEHLAYPINGKAAERVMQVIHQLSGHAISPQDVKN